MSKNKAGRIHSGGFIIKIIFFSYFIEIFLGILQREMPACGKRRNVYICLEQISSKSKLICAHIACAADEMQKKKSSNKIQLLTLLLGIKQNGIFH